MTVAGVSSSAGSSITGGGGAAIPNIQQTATNPTDMSNIGYFSGVECDLTWALTNFTVYTVDPLCPSGYHEYSLPSTFWFPGINYGATACGMTLCIDWNALKDKGCF